MDKLKKMTSYRLFWPIVCLALVLLFNLIKSPSFFEISIKNGVLYGYLVDIFNRSSELIILAVGMTLCVASSAGTDISVGAIKTKYISSVVTLMLITPLPAHLPECGWIRNTTCQMTLCVFPTPTTNSRC